MSDCSRWTTAGGIASGGGGGSRGGSRGGGGGGSGGGGGGGGSARRCPTRGSALSKTSTMPSQASAIVTIAKAVKQMEADTQTTHQQMERTQQAVRSVARRSRTQKKLVQMMGKRMTALEERLKVCMEGEAELFRKLNESRTLPPRRPRSTACCPPSKVAPPRPVSRSAGPSLARNRPPNAPRAKLRAVTSRPQSPSPTRQPVCKTKPSSTNTAIHPSKSSPTRPIINTKLKSNSLNSNSNVRDIPPPSPRPPPALRPFTFSRSAAQPASFKSVVRSTTSINQRSNVLLPIAERKMVPRTLSPAPPKGEHRILRSVSCTNSSAAETRTCYPIYEIPKTVRRSMSCVDPQSGDERPTSSSPLCRPPQSHLPPIFSNLRPPRRPPRSSSMPASDLRPSGLRPMLPFIDMPCDHARCSCPFPSFPPPFPIRPPMISPSSAVRLSFLSPPTRSILFRRVPFKTKPPQFTSPATTPETELPQSESQSNPPQADQTQTKVSSSHNPSSNNTQESSSCPSNSTTASPSNEATTLGSSCRKIRRRSISSSPNPQPNLTRSRPRSLADSPSPSTSARSASLPPGSMCCYPRSRKQPKQRPCCKKCLSALGRYLLRLSHEGRVEEIRTVLGTGVDVNFSNALKWTPLHKAASRAHDSVVSLLLGHGADVHAKTTYGLTSLHLAAYNDASGRCVALLIDAGSDIDSQSRSGRTPLDYADQCGNKTAVQALESVGASRTVVVNHRKLHFDPAN